MFLHLSSFIFIFLHLEVLAINFLWAIFSQSERAAITYVYFLFVLSMNKTLAAKQNMSYITLNIDFWFSFLKYLLFFLFKFKFSFLYGHTQLFTRSLYARPMYVWCDQNGVTAIEIPINWSDLHLNTKAYRALKKKKRWKKLVNLNKLKSTIQWTHFKSRSSSS